MSVKNRPEHNDGLANPFNNIENQKYITDPVFLIGNGNSRKIFDLERLRGVGTIIGCNGLYREFTPDLLVSIDAKLIKEIGKSGYSGQCIIPLNRTVELPTAFKWKTERFNTSGCFGLKFISKLLKPKECYMLGMDGYPGNVYDGTENYATNSLQNFSGVIKYYIQTLQEPDETVFINVNDKDMWGPEAHATGRYKNITYTEFEEKLNVGFNRK